MRNARRSLSMPTASLRTLRPSGPWPSLLRLQLLAGAAHTRRNDRHPDAITEVNSQPGRHICDPTGRVLLPARDEVTMRHFKFLGLEYWTAREEVLDSRRSDFEVESRLSHHYRRSPAERQALWDMVTRGARQLAGPAFEADHRAEGPRWWDGLPRAAGPELA